MHLLLSWHWSRVVWTSLTMAICRCISLPPQRGRRCWPCAGHGGCLSPSVVICRLALIGRRLSVRHQVSPTIVHPTVDRCCVVCLTVNRRLLSRRLSNCRPSTVQLSTVVTSSVRPLTVDRPTIDRRRVVCPTVDCRCIVCPTVDLRCIVCPTVDCRRIVYM